jgi:hypothetical protein
MHALPNLDSCRYGRTVDEHHHRSTSRFCFSSSYNLPSIILSVCPSHDSQTREVLDFVLVNSPSEQSDPVLKPRAR